MLLLSATDLTKSYGAVKVLDAVSCAVNAGERSGVVGANGAGKSTLLRLLASEELPDSGTITRAPGLTLGYLRQTSGAAPGTTIASLLAAAVAPLRALETRMRVLEAAMSAAGPAGAMGDDATHPDMAALLDEYGAVATRFQDADGYDLDHRMETVLAGLRVAHLPRERPLATLSGGEKTRVALAALLLQAPGLLLLDEPTNHLDLAALEWLEDYLAHYAGAALIVSHDRQFLDRCVTRIYAIDEQSHQMTRYEGGYSAYAAAKAAERARWEDEYARQQEEMRALRARMRETARQVGHKRPPTDPDKMAYDFHGGRVQDTVSRNIRAAAEQLRRLEADPVTKPPKPLRFNPRFRGDAIRSREVITLAGVSKGYGGRALLRDLHAVVPPGARIMLVGPNGAGKTTLLRLIAGLERPDSGEARRAPGIALGYLPQESALPDPTRTLLATYREGLAGPDAALIAGLIGHGFFRLEDIGKLAGQLSEGQRRKLEIARLIATQPNVLLLDEPTNAISLDVLEGFEAAILTFPGPVIAVSHDRRFIERFGGVVWHLEDGKMTTHAAGSAVDLSSIWDEAPA